MSSEPHVQAAQARSLLDVLDQRARRYTTQATPRGTVVWRSWGEGPPLVMLHGGAGSWMHWVRNIEALAHGRTLWLPDLPGFGDSDLPREGLDADSIAPIVLDGADTLLEGRSFDLLGFSFGSLVSGYMAQLAPDKVNRLVLAAATGLGIHVGARHDLRPLRGITDEEAREEVLRYNLGAIMIHDPAQIDALAVAVQDRSAQRDRVRNRQLARSDAMLRLAPGWRCPVSGIWGRDDGIRLRNPESFESATARLGLRQKHILPDAGHWVPFSAAEAFNALVAQLLPIG
jgi:2-hydroxy-6-oxonona-2,4-dienedioate hydrolase